MGEYTEKLNLYKPTLSEYFNLTIQFNNNWDELESRLGDLTAFTGLTEAEINQLKNIDTVEILNLAWGYMGAMNQGVAIKNSPVFLFPKGESFPDSPSEGQYFYRTDEDKLYIYDGETWDEIAGGVTDHGALTGLEDDDHSQYLNTTRHDITARHPVSVIKTSTGSAIGSINNDSTIEITMNRKSLFPQITTKDTHVDLRCKQVSSDPNNYISCFAIYNTSGSTTDYYIRWDYLSASSPPAIWVITDDKGKIIHCWESADVPDPDNPNLPPIEIPDMPADWHTIKVVIPANYRAIRKVADQAKKVLSSYLIDNYTVNLKTRKLKSL